MDSASNMSRGKLVVRALMAMILTGIVSALFVATGTAVFLSFSKPISAMAFAEFVTIVSFFGSFIALACAALLGLFVEWPKVKWLKARGIWPHLLTSIAGAEILLLTWMAISIAINPPSPISSDLGRGVLFVAIAAVVGGASSAMFWWRLVVKPMRKASEA